MRCASLATPKPRAVDETPFAARTPVRAILFIHAACIALVLGGALVTMLCGLPFETLALGPLALVELAMREIQLHPEEGIHVLARVQLPAYAGALHLAMLCLWAAAAALAARTPYGLLKRLALLAFPLAMLQDTAFLTLEHAEPTFLVQAIYLAALGATICAAPGAALRAPSLLLALAWLVVRTGADLVLDDGAPLLAVETLAGLLAPALWGYYLATRPPDGASGTNA